MEKAKAIVKKIDSSAAYNYRATPDAKARKEYEKAIEDFKDVFDFRTAFEKGYRIECHT